MGFGFSFTAYCCDPYRLFVCIFSQPPSFSPLFLWKRTVFDKRQYSTRTQRNSPQWSCSAYTTHDAHPDLSKQEGPQRRDTVIEWYSFKLMERKVELSQMEIEKQQKQMETEEQEMEKDEETSTTSEESVVKEDTQEKTESVAVLQGGVNEEESSQPDGSSPSISVAITKGSTASQGASGARPRAKAKGKGGSSANLGKREHNLITLADEQEHGMKEEEEGSRPKVLYTSQQLRNINRRSCYKLQPVPSDLNAMFIKGAPGNLADMKDDTKRVKGRKKLLKDGASFSPGDGRSLADSRGGGLGGSLRPQYGPASPAGSAARLSPADQKAAASTPGRDREQRGERDTYRDRDSYRDRDTKRDIRERGSTDRIERDRERAGPREKSLRGRSQGEERRYSGDDEGGNWRRRMGQKPPDHYGSENTRSGDRRGERGDRRRTEDWDLSFASSQDTPTTSSGRGDGNMDFEGRRLVPFSFDASGKSDSSGRDEEDEGGQLPIHMAPGAALDMSQRALEQQQRSQTKKAHGEVSILKHSDSLAAEALTSSNPDNTDYIDSLFATESDSVSSSAVDDSEDTPVVGSRFLRFFSGDGGALEKDPDTIAVAGTSLRHLLQSQAPSEETGSNGSQSAPALFEMGSGQGGGAGGGGFSFDAFAKSVTQAHGGQLPAVSPPSPTSSSSVESNSQAQSEVLRPQKPHTVPSNFQPAPARSEDPSAALMALLGVSGEHSGGEGKDSQAQFHSFTNANAAVPQQQFRGHYPPPPHYGGPPEPLNPYGRGGYVPHPPPLGGEGYVPTPGGGGPRMPPLHCPPPSHGQGAQISVPARQLPSGAQPIDLAGLMGRGGREEVEGYRGLTGAAGEGSGLQPEEAGGLERFFGKLNLQQPPPSIPPGSDMPFFSVEELERKMKS